MMLRLSFALILVLAALLQTWLLVSAATLENPTTITTVPITITTTESATTATAAADTLSTMAEVPTTLPPNFENINEFECGQRLRRTPKIINGSDAQHGQYPWMISLMLNHRHHCGGSLINGNWILTAAHCVYRIKSDRFQVKLGGNLRNDNAETTSLMFNHSVVAVPHPGFSFATFSDDLALVRLPERVEYTKYISPICLPETVDQQTDYLKAMVIGWGKLRQGGISPDTLQEVELPIIDNFKCLMWYREMGKLLTIRPTQICAGLEEGGKDACQGDSGSPMLVTRNKRSTVVGVVSAGIGCALPKLPGIYTRVSAYLPWIQETMKMYDEMAAATTTTAIPAEAFPASTRPPVAEQTTLPPAINGTEQQVSTNPPPTVVVEDSSTTTVNSAATTDDDQTMDTTTPNYLLELISSTLT